LTDQARPLKRELSQVEQSMAQAEQRKAALEACLSDANATAQTLAQAGRDLKTVTQELASLENRWLELSEALQGLEA